jgi:hypothetical protein
VSKTWRRFEERGDRQASAKNSEALCTCKPQTHGTVFAILAISKFGETVIKADYIRTKGVVASEAAALVMWEGFASYLEGKLWEQKRFIMGGTGRYPTALLQDASQASSWAPNLDILGHRSPHYHPFQSPVLPVHRSLLRLGGLAPIARFSDDLRVLYTEGFFMGRVIKKGSFDGRFATDHNYHGYHALRESLPHSAMLVGLFGLNVPFLLQQVPESPTYRILA